MRDPAGGSPSDLDDVNDEPLLDGPELAAELPLADLIEAIPSLLPAWWRCGEDPATPNSAAIFARPRERCASLEIDTRRSDLGVGDLEAGAQELSRRRAVRVVLWDDWSAIFLKEFEAGEQVASLISSHGGAYRGAGWYGIETGADPAPFPPELLPLLAAWRDSEFVEGLRTWQHGARGARGERVAQVFRRYVTSEASSEVRALLVAVLQEARATGSSALHGFGRVRWHALEDMDKIAVLPSLSLKRFFDGDGELGLDFSSYAAALGGAEVARATQQLAEALTMARDSAMDVVFPGLLCVTTRQLAGYSGTNPRTGEPVTIGGHLLPRFIFDERVLVDAGARPSIES